MSISAETYLEPEIDEYLSFFNSANSKSVKILRKERVKEKTGFRPVRKK